ncbi:alpha-glycosidase [Metabacillus sediminilitoris]|uniref:Alpha-glycosidase n=1 Tax=Metabacillus sediminilitoris TaxID=2567941 RepID=A0A4S4BYD2_9BACI|nr:alpha-glycosidase [Metabacillus sediminilitoris]QGQ44624.1 alpha-glycosidase [Metabacillus sediminilitoris]THF80251.1 alpha-glycosidase [Metabacillus sediminilitoris]
MLKEAIYHRPKNQFAYAYTDNSLHIQLRTKRNDIDVVSLTYGDQFEFENNHWKRRSLDMQKSGSDELFDYWVVEVIPPQRRLRYAFHLKNNEQELFYTERGFSDSIHDDFSAYFCFPYHHPSDRFAAPDWVKNTVWYQIFPDRFANGNVENDPSGTLQWNSTEPTTSSVFGGDFEGVLQHLDYLVDLGITGIYFTPIFKARSNHKYDTIDYMEIDPQFGDKATFKRLVNECHKHGIKVMLDAVFNHCGEDFPPFLDVIKNRNSSKYKDWFHLITTDQDHPTYHTFAFEKTMPKLNTQNPEVKKYLVEVGQYWVREFGIDGWRLDVANEIDHQFWREFRHAVKAINKDVYLVGEVWHDAMPWLHGDQFDAVMNYPLANLLLRFFAYDAIGAEQFSQELQGYLHQYPRSVQEAAFNLLGSHDTPRLVNLARMNKQKVKLLTAFQLSFTGSPSIYYGDEIGLTGEQDPGCRKCMVWDKNARDLDMLNFSKKLISLRKTYPILANDGLFSILEASNAQNTICYSRETTKQLFIAIMNNHPARQTLELPLNLIDQHIINLLTMEEFAAHSTKITITLDSYDFAFLLIYKK